MILDHLVTVCDACFRACCWQGEFLCDDARNAGTCDITVRELSIMGLEHPEYWFKSPDTGAIDQRALAEFHAEVATA